jgi:hypothetical protein
MTTRVQRLIKNGLLTLEELAMLPSLLMGKPKKGELGYRGRGPREYHAWNKGKHYSHKQSTPMHIEFTGGIRAHRS